MNDHDTWVSERDAAVWGPHGLASLAATHWLDATPRAFERTPGDWRGLDGRAVGSGVREPGDEVVLAPGDSLAIGDLVLRGFAREGAVALRVLDSATARARGISGILRFPFDPALRTTGTFRPGDAADSPTVSVDGHRSTTRYDGVVSFDVLGEPVQLAVEESDGGLFAAFADATSGDESHGFRFLRLPVPDASGTVAVDLNRALLPPCAFSDHYVCVLPPPGNRWSVAVRGGERLVR